MDQASHGYALAARLLMRARDRVALGTILPPDGRAYVSLAAVATDTDGAPILLLSALSDHTRNLALDPRLSLLFEATAGFANPQEGPRATLMGTAGKVTGAELERVRRRYLARHPGAALYAGFADFAFFRVAVERVHWVGGFGRAAWVERPVVLDAKLAAKFAAAEPALLAKLAPRAARIAKARLKRRSTDWSIAAIDPDGCDFVRGKRSLRLAFAAALDDPAKVEAALSGR